MATTTNFTIMTRNPHYSSSKYRLAAMSIFAGCILNIISSIIDIKSSYNRDDYNDRSLRYNHDDVRRELGHVSPMPPQASSKQALPAVVSRGAGPELTGLDGQVFNFDGEARHIEHGVTWYKILSSPRFQWNMSPHLWNTCPDGENMFLGDSGFTFRVPDPSPRDPRKMVPMISKYLRFRVERSDQRECLWNSARACLGGGNFIMNFGKKARNILYPGDYSLVTSDGAIRIVAYNTNRDCSRRMAASPGDVTAPPRANEKAPIDYLRQGKASTLKPRRCKAWIKERELEDDLFTFNSDFSTVHIDTPWMQITIQVGQSKVATEDTCVHATMNIWITNMIPELLEDEFSGVLGEHHHLTYFSYAPKMMSRDLKHEDIEEHIVAGPFETYNSALCKWVGYGCEEG